MACLCNIPGSYSNEELSFTPEITAVLDIQYVT